MRSEQGIICEITQSCVQVSDDYGEIIVINRASVVGEVRLGATVTVVHGYNRTYAFVEPKENPARISTEESGVVLIDRYLQKTG